MSHLVHVVDHEEKKEKEKTMENIRGQYLYRCSLFLSSHILPVPPRPQPLLALVAVRSERGHDHVWHDASVHSARYLVRGWTSVDENVVRRTSIKKKTKRMMKYFTYKMNVKEENDSIYIRRSVKMKHLYWY